MERKLLAIYLNDHLAGAVVGVELAKRCARNNEGTPLGDFLERLRTEVDEDRQSLEDLMATLDVAKSPLKASGAWLAEKVGRLKLNGQVTGYSDLSRLEELEGLALGVEGKLSLWRSLEQVMDRYPEIPSNELARLKDRAERQRDELERFRREAASTAL